MDKYLLLLLKEVNTIIIPDLGALTITNHSTGEIMFMPFLKYDLFLCLDQTFLNQPK